MHWRIQLLILLLLLGAVIMGYLRLNRDRINQNAPAAQIEVTPEPIDEDLGVVNEDDKVVNFAKVLAVPFDISEEASQSAMLEFISENRPGMVILFGQKITTDQAVAAIEEIRNQVFEEDYPLIAVDHEGGSVQRLNGNGFTALPSWKRMCDQDAELRQAELATSAAELSQVGIDVVLAPMVDVAESNSALRDRVCDGDVDVVVAAADDYISAFQQQNITPVIKHYPGLGRVNTNLHDGFASVAIIEQDVEPFKRLLDIYPEIGVMTSHVGVENQIPGLPCSQSYSCISQLFELYPSVLVMSDAIDMQAALYNHNNEDLPKSISSATNDALLAGNHLILFGPQVTTDDLNEVLKSIKTEYTSSEEFRLRINDAVKRIENVERHLQIDN